MLRSPRFHWDNEDVHLSSSSSQALEGPATFLRMMRIRMAPKRAMRNPTGSSARYHPNPRPMNPPSKAPPTPSKIVRIHPPGSGPGVRNFATTPTSSPNTIQPMIDMTPPWLKAMLIITHRPLTFFPALVTMLNDGVGRFHLTSLGRRVDFELPPYVSGLRQNRSSPSLRPTGNECSW